MTLSGGNRSKLDDASASARGKDPSTQEQGAGDNDSSAICTDSTFYDDDDDDELSAGDADEHALSFRATSEDFDELDVDLSPWPPLLAMLDSTEPEESPDDGPFNPSEGVEGPHALELRAESMVHYAERGAQRTGELDRTEVGLSNDNRDIVAGRDQVEIDGMLDEHTGDGLVHIADELELNVEGPLRMHAHREDNIIMAGVMTDEWSGGSFVTAAMSDDMAAGVGLRCTAPLDLWVHGLVGMEERPGTCAADGLLFELAGTLYEREYGPSAHVAAVARHSGTVVTTMKTGFRPLMKVAMGVRNLIPGGGGGGDQASASSPAAPPVVGGGEAAGAVTLTAVEGGGALGRGATGGVDTDEVVSVVRTLENASDATEAEDLHHPASTADNLDDLARVDVEETGYRQVADIYEQPVPVAAASESTPAPVPGRSPAGADRTPPLNLTEPGTEGYDFRKSYGSLRERNHFYRLDANWRGNFEMRDLLDGIDSRAIALFEGAGGSLSDVTGDYRTRTSAIHTALAAMAEQPEIAADAERLADIRRAIDDLEGLVQDGLVETAARTDEFAGTALGSQRVPIDRHIDTDMLRNWFQEQLDQTRDKFAWASTIDDPNAEVPLHQLAGWEAEYYGQMLQSVDKGVNPLADSSEQIAFLRKKVEDYYKGYEEAAAAHLAATGEELAIPVPREQYELDLYRDLQKQLVMTLSDPEYIRSIEEMGADTFAPPVRTRIDEGLDYLGPDSLRPLAEDVDEPDVIPLLGPEVQPPPPDHPAADPRPGAGSPGSGSFSRDPPLLVHTRPGTEGYDFQKAIGSLGLRKQFYREEMNLRGNFFVRMYLQDIDSTALELFERFGGSANQVSGDNFSILTPGIYQALEEMAGEARWSGDVNRANDIRAAMDEIESMVDGTLAEVAARTDEFSGAALGSQHGPIDRNIDTQELRRWLEDRRLEAKARHFTAETPEAGQLAAWEWGYYEQLVQSLDAGMNPLAYSNDQVAILRINATDPRTVQSAGEVDVYTELHELLIATLSDPAFHRSTEEMGADAFTAPVRSRIEAGLDFLGPDSLRPVAGGEIPPPLPAVDFADSAGYVDEVRDRSFSRSTLAASEVTLERQAAGVAEGGASVRGRASDPGPATREPSLGTRRAPPDNAQAPNIDERSGRWVVEAYAAPDATEAPAHGASTLTQGDAATSQASDVSWESGLLVSDDSEVDAAAGAGGDADKSNLFKAAPEPVDEGLEGTDEAPHAPSANDDGATASRNEDVNPTGAVCEPGDPTTSPDSGHGIGSGPSGTTSPTTPGTPNPVSTGTPRNVPGTGTTPTGASATQADASATATRSDLYKEPASFEGRSLEGAPASDDPKELARVLDGAQIPVEDLSQVEPHAAAPARKPIAESPDGGPVSDSYRDLHDQVVRARREWAEDGMRRATGTADSVSRSGRSRRPAVPEAGARWSESIATRRASSVSFGDDPRQLLSEIEYEGTRYSSRRQRLVDLYRDADPPNTVDRSHATHYIPRPRGREPVHETGFGRLSHGWNQHPFSHRERILNTLSKGEALYPEEIAALQSGLEAYRAAEGGISSSRYRAMVDMISDLGDPHRRTLWHMHGWRRQRLLQLIEMLEYATVVV